jgi:hypothetical protein
MSNKFQNREARDEDLEMIQSLRAGLHGNEETIKKLEVC